MAKRLAINHGEIAIRAVGPRDFALLPRVQRLNINWNQDTNEINELGNPGKAGISRRSPTVTADIDTLDVSVKNFSVLTGSDPTAFPVSGVAIQDLKEVDLVVLIRDQNVADIAKAAVLERASVSEINWRFSVDGDVEENYSFKAGKRYWFKNEVFTEKQVGTGTSFTPTHTPIQLRDGRYFISVIVDGERFKEVTGTPGAGEYAYDSGTNTITLGTAATSYVILTYQVSTPSVNDWQDVGDQTYPAAVTGRDVKVKILANDIPRVQSLEVRASFDSEDVFELGSRDAIGAQAKPPTVEGTLTVLDTDTELIELLSEGGLNSGYTEFDFGKGCAVSGLSLKIYIYDPCDPNQSTVLKTIYLPAIEVTGDSYTANVNDLVQQVFNWRSVDGRVIIYSGMV